MTAFTVDLAGVPVDQRTAALDALAAALHAEFPAFRAERCSPDADRAVIIVAADAGTPRAALDRLDGWGHGHLSLRLNDEFVLHRAQCRWVAPARHQRHPSPADVPAW